MKEKKKKVKMKNNKPESKYLKMSPEWLAVTKTAGIVLVFSCLALFFYFFQPEFFIFQKEEPQNQQDLPPAETPMEDPCPGCKARLFDGVVDAPQSEKSRPYAVMIDNYPAARPPFGLSKASLVYEAPVEGGITRYLAFFLPESAPAKIGPVRSARQYYVDIAKETKATYVHVGGSPESLISVRDLGNSDLNQFYKGSYFWRESTRPAPHNVLISGDNLNRYRLDYPEKAPDFEAWKYKQAATSTENEKVSRIDLKYRNTYSVYWQYDKNLNKYKRFLDNAMHADESGSQILADNIVVHLTSFTIVDDSSRLSMSKASAGQALLCQDGNCMVGKYKKNGLSRTRYYLSDNEEFVFNAGVTWIEMIGNWNDVKY